MTPGTATARGQLAYVFYDRVESLSEYFSTAIGQVLGGAVAHEIGHLLLPYHSHSRSGLMRVSWISEDFQNLARGWLLFTPEQGALMRARLAQEGRLRSGGADERPTTNRNLTRDTR